uniref:Uncharacterized protein n=1 Tax=Glossina brevipalpis TaxID=37001 RepID=A0A1A9WKI9_9MUSC
MNPPTSSMQLFDFKYLLFLLMYIILPGIDNHYYNVMYNFSKFEAASQLFGSVLSVILINRGMFGFIFLIAIPSSNQKNFFRIVFNELPLASREKYAVTQAIYLGKWVVNLRMRYMNCNKHLRFLLEKLI